MHACLCGNCVFMLTCVYLCLLYLFQAEHFLLSSRRSGVYGSTAVKKIPRIHSEKRLAFMLRWRGLPMTSFTLAHCLFDPVVAVSVGALFLFLLSPIGPCVCMCLRVPVICKPGKLFPHLLWLASKTLQPWGSHPPHTAPTSFSGYLGSHWQSIVCYTDMPFVYRGS